MGSRSRSGRRPHPTRDRRPESEDTEIDSRGDPSSFRFRCPGGSAESLGELLRACKTGWGGFALIVEDVASTNDLARDLAKRGAPHGSLVLAETQASGRGRWKRRWESSAGGLYMSVILRPAGAVGTTRLSLLPVLASLAAADALEAVSGLTVRLRWPNDLYRDGRKLGGVLCETSFTGDAAEHAIVGFGINVNQSEESFPPEIASSATSMWCLLRRAFDRLEVAAHIVRQLERWWNEIETEVALERFRELAEGLEGHAIQVRTSGSTFVGRSLGISKDGGLLVELPDGTEQKLYSDDVLLLRQDAADRDPAPASYYASVERRFVELRGSPLFITPSEWQLVWEWEQRGIPLHVVMQGIGRVFERPKTRLKPRKLGYCRQTVEAAYRRFREGALGSGATPATDEAQDAKAQWIEMKESLARARVGWKERNLLVAEAIERCESGVEALGERFATDSLVEIEEALAGEENRLLDALERCCDEERRKALRRESEASLADYRARMPEKVYASAVRSAYRRRLRLEIGLPTLSLYDR